MFEPLLWGAAIGAGLNIVFFDVGEKKYIRQGLKHTEVSKATKKYITKRSLTALGITFLFATAIGMNSLVINLGMLIGGVVSIPAVSHLLSKHNRG
jgi:hypothetical protein